LEMRHRSQTYRAAKFASVNPSRLSGVIVQRRTDCRPTQRTHRLVLPRGSQVCESQRKRPTACAHPCIVVERVEFSACCGTKGRSGRLRQQHPGDRQVCRRIASSEIAELDHGRETTVADEQIARMKIAMDHGGVERTRSHRSSTATQTPARTSPADRGPRHESSGAHLATGYVEHPWVRVDGAREETVPKRLLIARQKLGLERAPC
jgi:hypothetical protein